MVGAVGLTRIEVLRDVDHLASLETAAPGEVVALEKSTGREAERSVGDTVLLRQP